MKEIHVRSQVKWFKYREYDFTVLQGQELGPAMTSEMGSD